MMSAIDLDDHRLEYRLMPAARPDAPMVVFLPRRRWRRCLEASAREAGGGCETLLREDCGHAPHRDRRDAVLAAAARFIAALR